MLKPLLLVVFVANLFMLVLSTDKTSGKCGKTTQPPCQTTEPPSCRINEIWSNCPIAVCAPKTCNDVGYPVACPDLLPNGRCPVPPACICKEGFVRNHAGICIPMTQCPKCGGDPNAVSGCGSNCNRLCSNYNKKHPDACTMSCTYNGCDCRLGFVLDEVTGLCVFPSNCTYLTCNVKNEIYDPCPADCPFHTCGIDDRLISCVPPLYPGDPDCAPPRCRCKDGYYRDDEGECVLWENCPVCSGINEMYDPCPAPCPPQTCDVNIALILCAVPPKLGDPECQPGCRCIDNHVRNHKGVCIPRDKCPTCPNPNEVYDPCIAPCPPRRCDVDERLIKCGAPPKLGDKDCVAGCRCADGFYRNSYGVCVTRDECPTCPNPNEVYDPCIAPCPPRRCDVDDRLIRCPAPPQLGDKDCVAGCRCDDGYYRNDFGVCVTRDECPAKCKGKHEVYSECIQGDCKPKTCKELGFPVACPRIDPKYCEKGCLCKEGYVRDKNNDCIPKENCPSCGGDYNAISGCGVHCNNFCSDIGKEPSFCIEVCYENACDCREGYYFENSTQKCLLPEQCKQTCGIHERYSNCVQNDCEPQNCDQLGFPINCPVIDQKYCKGGCLCDFGYVRSAKGCCIPAKDCPSCGGDPNAVSGCGKNCGRLCSNYKEKGVACTLECKINGCDCRKSYVYDTNTGMCVSPKNCTPVCNKKHEEYSECINGGCTRKNCSQLGSPVPCLKIDPKDCIKGCLCKERYLRECNGECVLEKDCKPKCNKANEYYEPCGYTCPPNTCESLDKLYKCPAQTKDKCKGLCKCKKGYYRNIAGECITEAQCRMCNGSHEFYACGGACDTECDSLGKTCPIVNIKCNEKCYCEKNYARAKNGTCIPIKDCDKPQCKKNERYEECPAWSCKPKKCCDVGYPMACPDIDENAKCPVKPACVCIDGYVKNETGVCVPVKDCPSCGGDPNAEPGCGTNCGKKCEDVGKKPGVCPFVCLQNSCDCKPGYFYSKDKKMCVPASECPGVCSGKNEVYEDCTNPSCRAHKCSELGFPLNCTDEPECTKGCVCKVGYVRSCKGVCIPENECPSCGGDPNAVSGCGKNCGRLCSNYKEKGVACTLECKINGCDCRKSYVYDTNTGMCVSPKNCTPVCNKKNEEYSECINGGCTRKNCSQLGSPVPCLKIDPKDCIKGCLCKERYLRECNGECVLEKDCKPKCNKANEYYEPCGYTCPPNTCESLDKLYKCPAQTKDNCKGLCKCKKGYYRNIAGECITEAQCRMCNGSHEFYACGGACDTECDSLGTTCPIVNIKCNEKCYCEKNYARAKNGTCIPIKDCNKPQCKINQVYEKCPAWTCKPKTCDDVGKPIPCPAISEDAKCPVKPACICIDGYVMNATGDCIPIKQCPTCGGDPNAEPGCGTNCGKKCEDLGRENVACPLICRLNACDCKDSFYYDKNKGKCVPASECTGICSGKNEVFEDCKNPTCRAKTCSELGFPLNCTYVPECKKGCVCKDGHVRSSKGVCIPEKDCPSCGGDENAQSGCGVNCLKTCYDFLNPDKPKPCIKICRVNACDCKDDFYYDENIGKCVPSCNCTGICSGKNEVFEDCKNPTCRAKTCSELGFPLNCTYVPECKKGCVCKDGHVRSSKGVCIPEKDCPSCGGDENAQSGCGVNCLKTCYDFLNPDKPKPCIKICRVNACDCKDDFYYDENIGKCVPSCKCTQPCGKDEVYDNCTNGGCNIKKCSQIGGPMPSKEPKECIPGCSCKDGYLQSSKGVCIPAEKCPRAKCGKNERFIMCANSFCGARRCDQLGYPIKCPDIKDGCCGPPGCICAENHVRNDDGTCIPVRDCPSCGGDPNAWSGCGVNCGKHCDDINNKTRICLKICKENACDCKDTFYYDDKKGQCVKPDCCTPPCPDNEEYDNCVNGGCGWRNCSQINDPMPCIDPIKCKGGCTCKKDYLRDDETGVCVLKNKCPKKCEKPNEVFVKCPPKCPQTCESINKTYHCPKILVKINESDCIGECRCKEGYYRNLNNECISKDDCAKCKGDYEYHSCGPECDNVCCDLDTQSKDNCPKKNKRCVEMCYCLDGYARNDDGECIPIDKCPDRKPNVTVALANFQRGNLKLIMQLLQGYLDSRPDENIMLSALSIMMALGPLTSSAVDDSLEQLLNLFYLKNKEELNTVIPIIIQGLKDPENVIFELKNKIYSNEDTCPLTDEFTDTVEKVFYAEAENIDFSQNVKAAATINDWVSGSTKGLIKELVKAEMLSGLTRLAVFNVLYFLGNWTHQFDEKKTKPAKFYLNDEDSVMVPTMNQINTFQYGESDELDAQIIVLPYKGEQYKLTIILPKSKTGLKSVIEKIDADILDKIKESLNYERCNVSMPRMDFSNDYSDLKASLVKIGLSAPFASDSDDFKGICNNNDQLTISDIIQKTVFKCNERGTEAAAATGAILTARSLPRPTTLYNFNANCPFIFILESLDTILLSGAFVNG